MRRETLPGWSGRAAVDGTACVLEWMAANGHTPDMALVGEPTSRARLGDTVKTGRRGSMNASITLHGKQGHSAYPQRAAQARTSSSTAR
jgi:succinyl-diaminopimelate desuccinylase